MMRPPRRTLIETVYKPSAAEPILAAYSTFDQKTVLVKNGSNGQVINTEKRMIWLVILVVLVMVVSVKCVFIQQGHSNQRTGDVHV
jgi:hypothetical protein